jgi:hypothetical protein
MVAVHGLACLFGQFKPDGSPGLFLPNGRPIDGIAIWRNVLDPEGDDITTPQLAVDGQIEHGQITDSLVDLELGPDRPDVFLSQRRLGSNQLPFVPGYPPGGRQ